MKRRINKSERKIQSAGRLQKPKDLNEHARQVTFAVLTSSKVIQHRPVFVCDCITTA